MVWKLFTIEVVRNLVTIVTCLALLGCGNNHKDSLNDLRDRIRTELQTVEGVFAVAFRDLEDSSISLFINEKEVFHAASTMKVPVMMELFRQSRSGELNLMDSVEIKNQFNSIVDQSVYQLDSAEDSEKQLYQLIGTKRSIYDLNYDMIIWSSNLATNILIELANADRITRSMRDLGAMDIEVMRGVEDLKAYEQGLNNTTTAFDLLLVLEAIAKDHLTPVSDSKEMIGIMKDQRFNEIIPALLPEDVEVAHKTGTITALHHDAGLVFLPNGSVYTLVLLSKNLGDFDLGTEAMANVSRIIYDYYINRM